MSVAQAIYLSIAKQFSETPGPRQPDEGDHSGQQFLDDLLAPAFERAKRDGVKLIVDLDSTEGYATSFLEAAFGGLARRYPSREILETVSFKSDDEPYLIEEITRYVNDANKK